VEVPFRIVPAGAGSGEPKVSVTTPNGQTLQCPTEFTPDGFASKFTPNEAGPHTVDVTFADKPIPNSPFKVDAVPSTVDISKVQVKELPQSKQLTFLTFCI
jgi:hypothetical protein